jgi:hypothetical protein
MGTTKITHQRGYDRALAAKTASDLNNYTKIAGLLTTDAIGKWY